MDKKEQIIEFCALVSFVNNKTHDLNLKRRGFHNVGYGFEEYHSKDIEELNDACYKIEKHIKILSR